MTPAEARGKSRLLFGATLLCVLGAWAVLTLATPFGAGPDEPSHVAYGGFILRHGRLPTPGVDVVLQAHHPPLYYAFLAMLGGLRPDAVAVALRDAGGDAARARELFELRRTRPDDETFLPGPYRIAIAPSRPVEDHYRPFHALAAAAQGEALAPGYTTEGFLLLLRATGGLLLAFATFFIFVGARGAAGAAEGCVAAAAVALVPQNAADFAFVNSDQFAILFSAAAFAVLAAPSSRPLDASTRPLWAGVLLGLGLLSKLFAAGACVACATFLFLASDAPLRRRLRAVLLLALPAAALGLPWIVRQYALGAGVDPVLTSGMRAPGALKPYAPDAGWLVNFAAELSRHWFSSVGRKLATPGSALELLGAAFPLVATGGSVAALLDRRTPRVGRAAAAAFLAGLVVQVVAVVAANVRFSSPQGRYLHALDVPGAAALAVGARALFAERARAVLATMAVVAVAASFATAAFGVLPLERPRADRFADPDFAAYVDAGAAYAPEGAGPRVRDAFVPRPEDDVLAAPREVSVGLPPLVPGAPYVALIRSRRLNRPGEFFTAWCDDLRLGGPFTPETTDDWIRMPFVAPEGVDRAAGPRLRLRVPFDAWTATLAEALILRAPFAPPVASLDGADVVVALASAAPARLPPLRVALEGGADAPVPATFDGAGVARCRFAAPPAPRGAATSSRGAGPLRVLVSEPPRAVADIKLNNVDGPEGSRVERGFATSPGFVALEAPATDAPRVVAALYQFDRTLPEGAFDAVVLDERGVAVKPGLLAWRVGDRLDDAASARLVVPVGAGDGTRIADLVQLGPAVVFDRLVLVAAPTYRFDVSDPRR